VENEYTPEKLVLFDISVPKIFTISRNLTKLRQKISLHSFFETRCRLSVTHKARHPDSFKPSIRHISPFSHSLIPPLPLISAVYVLLYIVRFVHCLVFNSCYCLYRATVSAVSCLVVPAVICTDLPIAMCLENQMMMIMINSSTVRVTENDKEKHT